MTLASHASQVHKTSLRHTTTPPGPRLLPTSVLPHREPHVPEPTFIHTSLLDSNLNPFYMFTLINIYIFFFQKRLMCREILVKINTFKRLVLPSCAAKYVLP